MVKNITWMGPPVATICEIKCVLFSPLKEKKKPLDLSPCCTRFPSSPGWWAGTWWAWPTGGCRSSCTQSLGCRRRLEDRCIREGSSCEIMDFHDCVLIILSEIAPERKKKMRNFSQEALFVRRGRTKAQSNPPDLFFLSALGYFCLAGKQEEKTENSKDALFPRAIFLGGFFCEDEPAKLPHRLFSHRWRERKKKY